MGTGPRIRRRLTPDTADTPPIVGVLCSRAPDLTFDLPEPTGHADPPTDSSAAFAGEAEIIPLWCTQIDAIDAGFAWSPSAPLPSRSGRPLPGGVRVELGRERLVLDGYRQTLGEDGVALPAARCLACRGSAVRLRRKDPRPV
jgi:chorismate mutase